MAELRVKSTGTLKLFENDNTSSVTIASPASLGADRTVTLPDASVTLASGTMLATDGDGSSLTGLPDNTPRFRVRKTSDQSITDSTTTKVTWDVEDYDTDSAFASDKFTVPAGGGGTYHFYGQLKHSSSQQNDIVGAAITLYKNGAALQTYIFAGGGFISGTEYPYLAGTLTMAATVVLVATDYMELYGYVKTSGLGTPNFSEANGEGCVFEGFKIG